MLNVYGFVFNLLAGLAVGLGVNWLADWLPAYGSGASTALRVRHWRRWGVVMIASVLFGGYLSMLWARPGASSLPNGWILWSFFALFLLILVVDLEHRRVLNVVVYPMACIGLVLTFARQDIAFSSALIGGLIGFAIFFLFFLVRPGGLGAGDIKLAGLIGILVGFPSVLVALVAAILLGGLGTVFLLLSRRIGLRGTMAYAPYLSFGAMLALIHGPAIVAWYLAHFGIV